MPTEVNPVVSPASRQPGRMSILGGVDPLIDPATGGYYGVDSPSTVPQPPMTGSSDAGSPVGVAAPAGGSFDWSTILSNLFNAGSGSWYSGLGTYGVLGGIGAYNASQAQKANQATIAPINAIGQPLVTAGQGLLGEAMTGQLTPAQQQVVTTSQQQGAALINAATPVGQIAQGLFTQYQSGQLKPADQAQLDQSVAAAKQQLLQALGPNADSSMLATYGAQIDQQALITKQNILNGYLATGNTEFDQWASTTQAGQATILAGQQYAVQQIDTTFQQALEASSLGGSDILAGIQLAVQSNTEIANALQSYYGNLAKAYALQKAGGSGSSGGGSGTNQAANTILKNLINQLSGDTGAIDYTSQIGDLSGLNTGSFDYSGLPGVDTSGYTALGPTGTAGDIVGPAGDLSGLTGAGDLTGASDLGGLGFSTAGGGAATETGVGAIGAGTAGPEAAAPATGLGVGAGAATAVGLAALPVIAGLETSPVSLSGDYWSNFNANLAQHHSPSDITQAMLQLGGGSYGSTGAIGGGTQISPEEWQVLSQYGITPESISQLFAGLTVPSGGQGAFGNNPTSRAPQ